jgi:hypothetical protein
VLSDVTCEFALWSSFERLELMFTNDYDVRFENLLDARS